MQNCIQVKSSEENNHKKVIRVLIKSGEIVVAKVLLD